MKKNALLAVILAAAVLLAACSAARVDRDENESYGGGPMPTRAPAAAAPAALPPMAVSEMQDAAYTNVAGEAGRGDGGTSAIPVMGEKIVYNADISMETFDFDADLAAIENQVAAYGGRVQQSSVSGTAYTQPGGYGRYSHITARVPADNYNGLVAALRGVGHNVSLSTHSDDITMQYMDSKARLDAYRAQMDRMNELIAKSEKIEDIIKIQEQITELMYQIESLEGQLRYQDSQVAYSTVTISLTEAQKRDIIVTPPESLGERIQVSFFETLNGVISGTQDFIVWLIGRSPVLIPIAVILTLGIRLALKGGKKKKA